MRPERRSRPASKRRAVDGRLVTGAVMNCRTIIVSLMGDHWLNRAVIIYGSTRDASRQPVLRDRINDSVRFGVAPSRVRFFNSGVYLNYLINREKCLE